MRPEIALHSCDSNPMYLDFWPLVSKVWRLRMGIEPVLIYIDENHDIPIDTTYGRVLKLKPIPGIPAYMHGVWGRFWGACLFPDKVCIVSDIDMFPISKTYFIGQLRNVPDTKYVHLYSPVGRVTVNVKTRHQLWCSSEKTFPVCYHVAKGSLLTSVLRINPSWEDSMRDLASHSYVSAGAHTATAAARPQWGIDEDYTTKLLDEYGDKSIFHFIPRYHLRLDRGGWIYEPSDIKSDAYGDCHSVRPLSDPENRKKVNELLALLV
jgi:hypothetical protein